MHELDGALSGQLFALRVSFLGWERGGLPASAGPLPCAEATSQEPTLQGAVEARHGEVADPRVVSCDLGCSSFLVIVETGMLPSKLGSGGFPQQAILRWICSAAIPWAAT